MARASYSLHRLSLLLFHVLAHAHSSGGHEKCANVVHDLEGSRPQPDAEVEK